MYEKAYMEIERARRDKPSSETSANSSTASIRQPRSVDEDSIEEKGRDEINEMIDLKADGARRFHTGEGGHVRSESVVINTWQLVCICVLHQISGKTCLKT